MDSFNKKDRGRDSGLCQTPHMNVQKYSLAAAYVPLIALQLISISSADRNSFVYMDALITCIGLALFYISYIGSKFATRTASIIAATYGMFYVISSIYFSMHDGEPFLVAGMLGIFCCIAGIAAAMVQKCWELFANISQAVLFSLVPIGYCIILLAQDPLSYDANWEILTLEFIYFTISSIFMIMRSRKAAYALVIVLFTIASFFILRLIHSLMVAPSLLSTLYFAYLALIVSTIRVTLGQIRIISRIPSKKTVD